MTIELQRRVAQLENDLSLTLATVKTLAEKSQPPAESSHLTRFWAALQQPAIVAIIAALVPSTFTYFLVESVKQKFEERKLEAKNVTEMRDLLRGIYMGSKDAHANALTAATFGHSAVAPLIYLLEASAFDRIETAEDALSVAIIIDPEESCSILIRVLDNRTQGYKWFTHKSVIRLLGSVGCGSAKGDAKSALRRYAKLLASGDQNYYRAVIVPGNDSPEKLKDIRDLLNDALARLSEDE
jgi:hypothetical protein